jgi:hypothetical protein
VALKGNVRDFSLDEIVRFVCAGKKVGSLDIDNGQEAVSIYFKNGGIYFVSRTSRADSVTERVLSSVALPEEIKKSLSSGSAFPPAAAKIDDSVKEEIAKIILDETADNFADVLSWPKGDFVFKPGQQATREDWGIVIDADTFLEESRRRGEIFTRFFRFAESLDVVLVPNEEISHDEDVIISGKEWAFLCALRNVESLSDLVRDGTFSLTSAMLVATSLLEKGLLKVAGAPKRKREERAPEKAAQPQEEAPPAPAAAKEEQVTETPPAAPQVEEEPEKAELAVAGEGATQAEERSEEHEEENLIDELAAITGGFAQPEAGASGEGGASGDSTRDELMEILKSLKKL